MGFCFCHRAWPRADSLAASWPRLARPAAGQAPIRYRVFVAQDLFQGAAGDHLAPFHPGARAKIDDEIRASHRVLVMLNHDNRIAPGTKFTQRVQQLMIVAGMQPDGWLIQHIQRTAQV